MQSHPSWRHCVQDSPDGQPQRPRELRINPFRTFFPGQTYEPSVRNSAAHVHGAEAGSGLHAAGTGRADVGLRGGGSL